MADENSATATQEAPASAGGETAPASPPVEPAASTAEPAVASRPGEPTTGGSAGAADLGAPGGVEVRPAEFPQAEPALTAGPGGQVDILLGTMMPVAASLGQVKMPVRQLLQLGQGSVVKLDRQVGAPIDLFLRGIKFATGHLVVVGENLGVRINEILPVDATQEAASME